MENVFSKMDEFVKVAKRLPRLRGNIYVIKYGGSFMDSPDPTVRNGVAMDVTVLASAGIKSVIVHGGGKAITRTMDAAGLKAEFIQGMRVTDEAAVKVVDQVLSQEINPEIVAAITSLGGKARGFAGTDIFTCAKLWLKGPKGEQIDVGFVGEVTSVNTTPLQECLARGFIPVIGPTALGADGRTYNCNADVAAAQAAIALKANRLLFMSDVPGLLRDPKDPKTLIAQLRASEVEELKLSGVIDKGMIPKVDSAVAAAKAGVDRVSFVDGRAPHAVLLEIASDKSSGTEVVVSP